MAPSVSTSSTRGDRVLLAQVCKSAGQILKQGGVRVVFCDTCKTARMDGPEYCPTCGGPLRAVAGAQEGPKTLGEAFTPAKAVELSVVAVPTGAESSSPKRRGPKGKLYEYKGESHSLYQWADRVGVRHNTLYLRLQRGWTIERTLTTPEGAPRGRKVKTAPIVKADRDNETITPYAEIADRLRGEGVLAPIAPAAVVPLPALLETAPVLDVIADFNQWRATGAELQTRLKAELDRLIDSVDDVEDALGSVNRALQKEEE